MRVSWDTAEKPQPCAWSGEDSGMSAATGPQGRVQTDTELTVLQPQDDARRAAVSQQLGLGPKGNTPHLCSRQFIL